MAPDAPGRSPVEFTTRRLVVDVIRGGRTARLTFHDHVEKSSRRRPATVLNSPPVMCFYLSCALHIAFEARR